MLTLDLSLVDRQIGMTELSTPDNQNNNFFNATNTNGYITATATEISGLFNLQFDVDQGLIPLTINSVMIETQLVENPLGKEAGNYTNDTIAINPEIVGGMKIGGILSSDEFLTILDNQYRSCTCASVDLNQILIDTSIFFGNLLVTCVQNGLTPENCPVDSFCSSVGNFCSNAIGIGATFDIDENNDTVNDAYSIALLYAVAATFDGIIFTDSFEY